MVENFGPSPIQWSEGHPTSGEKAKNEVLVSVGQADLDDLKLQAVGEHTPDIVPLFNMYGEEIGSVKEIHFSPDSQALIGTIYCDRIYTNEDVNTELTEDASRVHRVILGKG